ncbi:hypothetical protein NLM33_35955 [Bradyrhizobium sp. CCGUVB1N3]|uniref:hypothetical protein n=1 Tax=Bradyrhizobium sp. CCGUVB1N3 TaxID=2949629 RepID=UPI0020B38626|nr:hypothetical protein [Bradyrhizobium sp. CCGUVB1N3]MCP3475671.1 hypothetical protein [Bradyrhizobium sp. CCGUVB1N3]
MTGNPQAKKQKQNPPNKLPDADDALISDFGETLMRLHPMRYVGYPGVLRRFSNWLKKGKKEPMTSRLFHDGLTDDAEQFKREFQNSAICPALALLREQHREPAGGHTGEGSSQQITGASSSTAAVSSFAIGSLGSLPSESSNRGLDLDLNAPLPDEWLISDFGSQANTAGRSQGVVAQQIGELKKFSAWRRQTGKPEMAGQLDQLHDDAQAYAVSQKVDPDAVATLKRAVKWLTEAAPRKTVSGGLRKAKYDEDDDLIDKYGATTDLNMKSASVRVYATALRRFSDWLFDNDKTPIARRLHRDELLEDADQFKVSSSDPSIRPALTKLRSFILEQADSSAGVDTPQRSSAQVPAQSLVELPSSGFGGGRPVAEYGHLVDLGWQHGRQAAPDILIAELTKNGLLPTTPFQSTHMYIFGQPYTAQLDPANGVVTGNNPRSGNNIILVPQIKLEPGESAGARIAHVPESQPFAQQWPTDT